MDHSDSQYDSIRQWAEGLMDARERRVFESAMEADAELAEEAERYSAILAPTVLKARASEEPELSFDELWRECRRAPRLRLLRVSAAVAAVLLGLVAWIFLAGRDGPPAPAQPVTIALRAIPLAAPEPPAPEPESASALPAVLADYEPVRDGAVQWLADLETAAVLARASGRPILVYEAMRGCPECRHLDRTTLVDADVLTAVRATVPVRIDLQSDVRKDVERVVGLFRVGKWPYFELRAPDAKHGVEFSGPRRAPEFLTGLHEGLAQYAGQPLPWATVHARARRAIAAERALDEGQLGAAYADLAANAAAEGDDVFSRRARLALERLSRSAHRQLERARTAARDGDPKRAREILDDAAATFTGTPMEPEFQQMARALADTNLFPTLTEAE